MVRFVIHLDLSKGTPPVLPTYIDYLERVQPSAPGRDGLPYSDWAYAGLLGAITLYRFGIAVAQGYYPPLSFNRAQGIFLAKGEDPLDQALVTRVPGDTRPLSMKRSLNKVVAGVNKFCMRTMFAFTA